MVGLCGTVQLRLREEVGVEAIKNSFSSGAFKEKSCQTTLTTITKIKVMKPKICYNFRYSSEEELGQKIGYIRENETSTYRAFFIQ